MDVTTELAAANKIRHAYNGAFFLNVRLYAYNTAPRRVFEDIYSKYLTHDSYRDEKCQHIQANFLEWAGSLDDKHLDRLITCIENYSGARD